MYKYVLSFFIIIVIKLLFTMLDMEELPYHTSSCDCVQSNFAVVMECQTYDDEDVIVLEGGSVAKFVLSPPIGLFTSQCGFNTA